MTDSNRKYAFLIDIDGTIFHHSTQTPMDGAKELLDEMVTKGHQIILTTWRGNGVFPDNHPVYSESATRIALEKNKIPFDQILFGVMSPRIVINDDGAGAINVVCNDPSWIEKLRVSL